MGEMGPSGPRRSSQGQVPPGGRGDLEGAVVQRKLLENPQTRRERDLNGPQTRRRGRSVQRTAHVTVRMPAPLQRRRSRSVPDLAGSGGQNTGQARPFLAM